MKKAILYIFLLLFIIGCIGIGCKSFYEVTSYYKWTDEALNAKLVLTNKDFLLKNSAANVTASGELMNCTNSIPEVEEGQIIIYCQDISTNEILSFKNTKSYTFNAKQEKTIFITIYDEVFSKENIDYASNLIEKYIILKIEYQISENEIYIINTISQTGSYLVPLGTIIAVPIILSILAVCLIIFLQNKKEKALNELISQFHTKKQIAVLLLLLIIPITFITGDIIAFIDKHWDIATFCTLIVIFGLILIGLVLFVAIVGIKSKRKIKIAKHIIKEKINANEKIEPLTFLANKKNQINIIKNQINTLNNEIQNYYNNKFLSEINNVDRLDGWQFENYCAKLFTTLGYQVTVTKGSGDFGADLILDNSISVQCKLYSGSVGIRALQEVYSSMARYKTKNAWVITNSTFTKQAKEYANDAQIKLIDRNILKQLIIKVFKTHSEDYLKERQSQIADLQNEINYINSVIVEIEKLNYLNYKEIKTLYKKYF